MTTEEKPIETPVQPPKIRCQMCGRAGGTEDLHPCPAFERTGIHMPYCNCCADCTEDCMLGLEDE